MKWRVYYTHKQHSRERERDTHTERERQRHLRVGISLFFLPGPPYHAHLIAKLSAAHFRGGMRDYWEGFRRDVFGGWQFGVGWVRSRREEECVGHLLGGGMGNFLSTQSGMSAKGEALLGGRRSNGVCRACISCGDSVMMLLSWFMRETLVCVCVCGCGCARRGRQVGCFTMWWVFDL